MIAMPQQHPDYRQLYNSMLTAFDAVNLNYFVMEIVCDENGQPVDGIYREVSSATERLIGKSKELLIGKSRRQLFGNVSDDFPSKFNTVLQTEQPVHFQSSGAALQKYYDVYAWKVADRQVAAIVTDITEHKKAEIALQSSEKQKNDILESITDAFVAFDKEWRYTYVNSNAARILHKPKEELIGKVGIELFPNASKFLAEFKRAVSSGCPVHFEEYYPEPLNIWYECHCYPSKDGLTVFFSDITQRKKAEEALSRLNEDLEARVLKRTQEVSSERQRLYNVLETLPAYVVLLDKDYCMPFANKVFRELFGESHGRPCYEFLFQRDKPCNDCETYKVLKTNTRYHWEWTGPNGRDYDIYDFPFLEADGSTLILEMGIDITEQKHALKQVHTASLYARSLIEASLDPLVTISIDGKIADVNKATELVTGCSREELIGSVFSDYFVEPKKAELGYKRVFTEGYVTDYPLAIKHKSGKITDVLYNAVVFRNESGHIQGVFAAARDVTAQKKAQEQAQESARKLKDAERLAAIGATAGMVGHDIRNPLQAITGDLYLAKTELAEIPDTPERKHALESIEEIEKNVDYINKIVQDLQDYARPLNPKAEEIDLNLIFERLFVKNRPVGIKLEIEVAEDARKILTDSYYLNRILYNLVNNSFQAMLNGGKLTIQTYREANGIVIAVKDTGVGIPSEIQSKMFTPMFTTKSKGQGFGLPVVKRMTESLGGTVCFESEAGKGTVFIVRLPSQKVP